jgi:hypothetical protein
MLPGQPVIALALCASLRGSLTDQQRPKPSSAGMDAHNNPHFYRQLGKDPDLLVVTALELLAKKLNL